MFRALFEWFKYGGAVPDKVIAEATVEDAVRENSKAFQEITQVYADLPGQYEAAKKKIEKVGTPFADLENLMRNELRSKRLQRAAAKRSRKYE